MDKVVKNNSKTKQVRDTAISVLVGISVALLLRGFVFENVVVPTNSMEPTVLVNDKLIGSRLAYLTEDPERGDIIVFECADFPDTKLLKRVIGLPGETLTIVNGEVFINNSKVPLDEPYVNDAETPTGDFGPYVIPNDSYFVMGDNRNHSLDSRYWESSTFVAKDDISSKIVFKYYPKPAKAE